MLSALFDVKSCASFENAIYNNNVNRTGCVFITFHLRKFNRR